MRQTTTPSALERAAGAGQTRQKYTRTLSCQLCKHIIVIISYRPIPNNILHKRNFCRGGEACSIFRRSTFEFVYS